MKIPKALEGLADSFKKKKTQEPHLLMSTILSYAPPISHNTPYMWIDSAVQSE